MAAHCPSQTPSYGTWSNRGDGGYFKLGNPGGFSGHQQIQKVLLNQFLSNNFKSSVLPAHGKDKQWRTVSWLPMLCWICHLFVLPDVQCELLTIFMRWNGIPQRSSHLVVQVCDSGSGGLALRRVVRLWD